MNLLASAPYVFAVAQIVMLIIGVGISYGVATQRIKNIEAARVAHAKECDDRHKDQDTAVAELKRRLDSLTDDKVERVRTEAQILQRLESIDERLKNLYEQQNKLSETFVRTELFARLERQVGDLQLKVDSIE